MEGRAIYTQWLRRISLAAVLAAHCRPEVLSAGTGPNRLRITIYDDARLPREILADAFDRLQVILQQAKIASHPVLGDRADPEASLFMYIATPSAGEESRIGCGARRDIALKIVGSSPKSLAQDVLGMSSPFVAFGLNVRMFNDHIREAALRYNLPHAAVLAYAMAHEIGHVLLRSGSHGSGGIMSGVWTAREYQQIAQGALVFSDGEAMRMWTNLLTPACPKPDRRPTWADQ